MIKNFFCASLSPIQLAPSLAIAAVKAGGIGLLDCQLCQIQELVKASDNLQQLIKQVDKDSLIGIRIAVKQLATHKQLLEQLSQNNHLLILSGWSASQLPKLLDELGSQNRQIWLEVRSSHEIFSVDMDFAGWVARGSESGGQSGHESAFILSQHLSKQHRPFIVQGGIGIHTASACRVAGAAGVILDDILLLLRESPLPARYRALIEQIGVEDTAVFGSPFGDPYRIVNRADFPSAQVLKEKAEEITTNFPEHGYSSAWDLVVEERVKIGNPDRHAWPFGQMVGLAALFAKKYKTVKKLFRAIYSSNHIQTIAKYQPLAPSAPLARFHNTSFPIVQGPMTRVSDSVAFAAAVATTGALPLLALAMMRAAEVETLLSEAKRVLDKQSWGIGILGFVPTELRQQQLEVVEKIKPPFALIAGGRPDQAAFLEKCSIKTYIHVPTPRLLSIFLEQGARRFVFEGAECGGHIGPLSSYVLWESMVETLIDHLPKDPVEILFAGGIHDSLSAAMAAIIAAPLVERGVKIGVLMGTAYLFTQEAVEQGAIVETFQNQALNCQQTVTVETRPGHKIRCAPTPFITTFEQKRKQLQHEGRPVSEIGEELEEFIAGRLRIASKGLERTNSLLTNIETEKQYHEGMYMIGEVASLRSSRLRCKNLHEDVSIGSTSLLNKLAKTLKTESQKDVSALDSPIAVVGIGCLLPKAEDVETLWRNLIDKVDTITEIPKERWDWRLYYDPNQTSRDKIYSKWGSFIDPIPFDPLHFGIPPKSLPSISLPQLLVLEATRRALCDAGYGDYIEDKELREQTSVFFGAANSGDLEQLYKTRSALPLCINSSDEEVWQRLPEWTEESYPGILVNIIAGRVSNRFDLGGSNFTVDAACGSSLAALEMAVRELQLGAADMVITGGVEFEQSPQAYMAFSKTRALSSQGKARVFDQNADGIVLSEGVVVLILKRLADAEMNGDRIYALIRSVAGSSDGKGMSLTAPKPEGQRRAFKRAYKIAGINPNTLGLYEAHATGTSVGDKAEIETITTVLQDSGSLPQSCAIGSAKSLLGHTRATAGMVGLVKAVMALYHRTLPPHAGVEKPIELLSSSISPVYLLSKAQPWLRSNHQTKRAGVSAFGFGGTNFHAVVEEYNWPGPSGADRWPYELFIISANDPNSLKIKLEQLEQASELVDKNGLRLRDLAFSTAIVDKKGAFKVAIVAANATELQQLIAVAKEGKDSALAHGLFCNFTKTERPSQLAFLFPGQGSQYVGMGEELAVYFPEMRRAFELTDLLLADSAESWSRIILPPAAFSQEDKERQRELLTNTRIAQPSVATISFGMLDLARKFGLKPTHVAGHSFGEYVALHAANAISRENLLYLAQARGQILSEIGQKPGTLSGAMATVSLTRTELEPYISNYPDVEVSNYNAPRQLVLSGESKQLDKIIEKLRNDGHNSIKLPVSTAFHSRLMRPARDQFAEFVRTRVELSLPELPVHSNLDGEPYPTDTEAIFSRWIEHLEQPVNFVAQIESMYKAGVRTFVEIGPGRVLTGLVKQILEDRPHLAISADGGVRSWLNLLAQLYVNNHQVEPEIVFDERSVTRIDFDSLPLVRSTGWLMDGGRIWPSNSTAKYSGEKQFLDYESRSTSLDFPELKTDHSIVTAYREYQQTMRQFLDQQERMLSHILTNSNGTAFSQQQPKLLPQIENIEAQKEQIELNTEIEVSLDTLNLTKKLVTIITERTGYAADAIDPERDLEAELGIDSIKRIEILTKFQKSLPSHLSSFLRSQFDRFTRAKSIKSLIELLTYEITETDITTDLTSSTFSTISSIPNNQEACPRFLMRSNEKTLLYLSDKPLKGLYLVTEDFLGVAKIVVSALEKHGAKVHTISHENLKSPKLDDYLSELRQHYGSVQGLIHLTPLGLKDTNSNDTIAWREATFLTTKSLFRLIQSSVQELNNRSEPMRILATSHLGGDWGRGRVFCGSAAGGGSYGILRCLEKDYPHILTKTVDFDDTLTPETMAEKIVNETVFPGGDQEVGYLRGRRIVFSAEKNALNRNTACYDWRPNPDWVVLATGGARGITAEICREVATKGIKLIVIGQSPLNQTSSEAEGKELEIRNNLRDFQQQGADVEYHVVDVRSEEVFGKFIDSIYARFGRLDAVLHGAGIIEDSSIEKKSFLSFERVFDTKADSTSILSRKLRPEQLKWILLFSSISGRFGNNGQYDYAAANETVNRLAWQMDSQWPKTRVLAINWGPWSSSGMASEGVQYLLQAQGITPIDPAVGRQFFVDEMTYGSKGEVEIIAGKGPWEHKADQVLSSVFEASFLLLHVRELTKIAERSR